MASKSNMTSIRCDAQTTRRLVDQEAGHVKNMDLDKLDSCGEVTLGLVATFGCALLVCMVALPFFDIVTMGWVKTWERHVGKVSMDDFKALHVFADNQFDDVNSAYTVMDTSEDGHVDLTEFRKFLNDLKQPIVKEEQVLFTFKGLDENFDDKLTAEEWDKGLSEPDFYYWEITTTTMPSADEPSSAEERQRAAAQEEAHAREQAAREQAAREQAAREQAERERAEREAAKHHPEPRPTRPKARIEKTPPEAIWKDEVSMKQLISHMGDAGKGSPQHALRSFDSDSDGIAAHDEFMDGLGKLPQPVKGEAAEGVFQSLDLNKDGMVTGQEFANAFNQKHYVQARGPRPEAQSHPKPDNGRKREVLKDLGLSQPPLTIKQFAQGMGSVTPETAFKALDADQNGEIAESEMVRFAKAFLPPLTEKQARYAQKGLDVNGDRRVVPQEMYDTLKFGEFFPTEDQARSS
eukprot:CAMPEP_0181438950 /NCGR_PEP_ID=MMETSP1110-20121109/22177_1 /TAXON_ID=174948 /ORGANISM="Symbiodinium sp., Strain CCMP421" /LENGTH=463 /DNA_ID=CAMNT_0023562661 /DNA_START=24 /DNA_END=1415 /DNA_ORIENTATION=-